MLTDFAAIGRSIELNPLGRLMYGNRELFHSNLIAWFFDAMPNQADRVFKAFTSAGAGTPRYVERERENLDLVMHWPDMRPLVIENKVFSTPTRAQLDDYSAKTARWPVTPAKLLLTPARPSFELDPWAFFGYGELSAAIVASLDDSDHSYEAETMRRYAALASDLGHLMAAVDIRSTNETIWLPEAVLASISSSQMRSALQKARASRIAAMINQTIPDLEQPASGGMTRATPLVESFEYVFTSDMHVHVGWQLQGTQFRRAVIFHDESLKGGERALRLERERISALHPEFFDFPPGLPQTRSGRRDYNHFAPSFVYQYVKAPDITVAELLDAAVAVHAATERLHARSSEAPRPPSAQRVAP